ncbi:MAG: methyltransferase, partial [Pontibacterium sp.]
MSETLTCPQGSFQLNRYPIKANEKLRAWDAADEYLLNYCAENGLTTENSILIVNDQFGALATALHACAPHSQSDSWLAQQGTRANLTANALHSNVTLHNSLTLPTQTFDWVLIKVPKSNAALEDTLYRLRSVITAQTRIIAAGMAKHIHTSTLKLFEKVLGPTKTSLAVKKARLIFCEYTQQDDNTCSPYPTQYSFDHAGATHSLINHSGVFSQDHLDIGTRFLLTHLPNDIKNKTVVDLACGNGIVGVACGLDNPNAQLIFTDESYMAVASAQENVRAILGDSRSAEFKQMDCLADIAANTADWVINNPPFHQQNVVGDFIARQMFQDAKRVLKQGGKIRVIGNRHLGYHVTLKRIFGNCQQIAANKKFVILDAV